jgi:hypothetical protein
MAVYKFSTNSLKTPLKYSSLLAGNPVFVPWEPAGAYDSIATASGAASSITFSSIPSTYKHLQLRLFMIGTSTSPQDVWGRFNSDTGSNYATHRMYGDGGTVATGGNLTSTKIDFFGWSNPTYPGVAVIDILDYADTSKKKTSRSLTGADSNNSSGYIFLTSGLWQSTSAINSITFFPQSGTFAAGTHAALYGIKGA